MLDGIIYLALIVFESIAHIIGNSIDVETAVFAVTEHLLYAIVGRNYHKTSFSEVIDIEIVDIAGAGSVGKHEVATICQ